jgi:glycosyltransferase involved in cell wall biosynthesis
MRVLLVSGEFPPVVGGMGDYTAKLAAALGPLGVEVAVLTSRAAGGSHHPFPFPVLARLQGWGFGSWQQVRQAALEFLPHILHIQYQAAAYGMHPAINLLPLRLRLARGPLVFTTFHDLRIPYLFPKAGRLRWWANLALLKTSHGVIVTDEGDRQRVAAHRQRLTYLIPIGPNIEPTQEPGPPHRSIRQRWGIGEDVFLVGYFGLLNESKGVDTLLRAYRSLLDRGQQVALLMVGASLGASDPTNLACQAATRELLKELGLERLVRWTGYLSAEDTSLALGCLDACALPYRDGASFRRGTLMAALAHGLPIVTTTPACTAGSGPRLADGENCRLIPPGDHQALAKALGALIGSPAQRERLAQGARELAQHFTWERIAASTVEAYREALAWQEGSKGGELD